MAYSNGNAVLVANATAQPITVGATTVASGKAAVCTPTDAVAVTLTAGLTKGTPVTSLACSALAQIVQAGSAVEIQQTDSAGVVHRDYAIASATAAAAGTSITINSLNPSFSYTTGATVLTSSQGQVAGAVDAGACVLTTFCSSGLNPIDSPAQQAEKAARFMESMVRALLSAGSDTFGDAGL